MDDDLVFVQQQIASGLRYHATEDNWPVEAIDRMLADFNTDLCEYLRCHQSEGFRLKSLSVGRSTLHPKFLSATVTVTSVNGGENSRTKAVSQETYAD